MKKLGLLSVIAALLLIGFATTNCNKKPDKGPQIDTVGLNLPTTTGGTTSSTGSTGGYTKFGEVRVTTYNNSQGNLAGVIVFLAGDLDSAKARKAYQYNGTTYQDTSGSTGSGNDAIIKFVPVRNKTYYVGAYKISTANDTLRAVPHVFDYKAKYSSSLPYVSDTISVK